MSEQQNETQNRDHMTDITPPKDGPADLAGLQNGSEAQPLPGSSAGRGRIRRRRLLLGGSVLAVMALAGGGTALTLVLKNRGKQTPGPLLSTPTPTVLTPQARTLLSSQITLTIKAHSDTVTNVLWHPTGRYLVSASNDQTIKLWDVESALQTN